MVKKSVIKPRDQYNEKPKEININENQNIALVAKSWQSTSLQNHVL